jgi:hypothetical protein
MRKQRLAELRILMAHSINSRSYIPSLIRLIILEISSRVSAQIRAAQQRPFQGYFHPHLFPLPAHRLISNNLPKAIL